MIILYILLLIIALVILRVLAWMPTDMLKDIIKFKFITANDIAYSALLWISAITAVWMLVKIIQYIF